MAKNRMNILTNQFPSPITKSAILETELSTNKKLDQI